MLNGVAYTIKMSKKGPREIEGYFDFVVPPLEDFWWQDHTDGCLLYTSSAPTSARSSCVPSSPATL